MSSDDVKNIAFAVGGFLLMRELVGLFRNPEISSINEIEVNPENLSFDPVVYDAKADALYYAFWEYGFIEDEDLVIEIMSTMNTNDDVKALIQAYGVRCWGPFCTPISLTTSIQLYLTEEERSEINQVFTEKGITLLV